MNRDRYTLKDFLEDPSFLNWVSKSRAKDMADWEDWLEKNPDKKTRVDEAADVVKGIHFKKKNLPAYVISDEWKNLESRIEKEKVQLPPAKKSNQFYYAAAAILTGILLLGTYFFLNRNTQITVATKMGEMKTFRLSDGTSITLRANSSITYSKDWDPGETRKLWLKGEGYFEVKHGNRNEKFNVITNELILQVKGTTFNISTRRGKTITVLNSGKIKLTGATGSPEVYMNPGDLTEFKKNDEKFLVTKVNPADYSGWVRHRFIFHNTSLRDISWMIEDLYGVTVQIKDPHLKSRKLSGEIEAHKLDELVRAISLSLNIKATGKENSIILEKK